MLAAIDIHKAVFQAAVLDFASGEITEERFKASREALVAWIEGCDGALDVVAIEATTGWRWVARELQARGIEVRLTDPGQASAFQGARKRPKTDRLDARWLVMLGRRAVRRPSRARQHLGGHLPSRPRRPRPAQPARPPDLLLDRLALLMTEGVAAAAPTLARACGAFAGGEPSTEEALRWAWLATAPAAVLWDFETWLAIYAQQLPLAREAGALAPFSALSGSRPGHLSGCCGTLRVRLRISRQPVWGRP